MRKELVTTEAPGDRDPKQAREGSGADPNTQHGVPSAYLVDVETFETLQCRMTLIACIARGEKAIEEGRSLTHKQAKRKMSRWLK